MIRTTSHEAVTILTLSNGPVNAADLDLWTDLGAAVAGAPDTHALVITGEGRAFCAGVDLKRLDEGGPDYSDAFITAMSAAVVQVFLHPRPVVAAVNGHAMGAGALLACAADTRLMSAGRIGLPEFLVGVPVPPALLEVARYVLGHRLQPLVMTAQLVEPEQAVALGLVDEVVSPESLLTTAVGRAAGLGRIPRQTYALTKMLWRDPVVQRIAATAEHEQTARAVWRSPEVRAAVRARLDSLRG